MDNHQSLVINSVINHQSTTTNDQLSPFIINHSTPSIIDHQSPYLHDHGGERLHLHGLGLQRVQFQNISRIAKLLAKYEWDGKPIFNKTQRIAKLSAKFSKTHDCKAIRKPQAGLQSYLQNTNYIVAKLFANHKRDCKAVISKTQTGLQSYF